MDDDIFRSRPYQFVYQYLHKYNAREHLDNFSFQKTVHGTPRECLSFLIQWVYTIIIHANSRFYNINIMAYGSTPYAEMPPTQMTATLKVHKWHARNVCFRLAKGMSECFHEQQNCYLCWRALLKYQIGKSLKLANRLSSKFLSSFCLSHTSTIIAEANTLI